MIGRKYSKTIISRLEDIEQRKTEKNRTPVIITELRRDGQYLWNGKNYTREELDKLQRKNKAVVIIDDVIGIAKGEMQ